MAGLSSCGAAAAAGGAGEAQAAQGQAAQQKVTEEQKAAAKAAEKAAAKRAKDLEDANVRGDTVILSDHHPWLFFCGNDGQPLETYQRTNLFSEEDLARVGENLHNLAQDLDSVGTKFILFIPPMKEEVYSEWMPSSIPVEDNEGRSMQLVNYMREHFPEIPVVYPLEEELAAKEHYGEQSLYYEGDCHWNEIGSHVGMEALLSAVGELTGHPYEPQYKTFTVGEDRIAGDLQMLVELGDEYLSTTYVPEEMTPYEITVQTAKTEEEFAQMVAAGQNPDIPVRKFLMVKEFAKNPEARMPVRTFITGDSFMLGMVPYVFDAFPETEAYSRYYLDMDAVLEMKPEVFIYEIAERYVSELDIIPGYNTAALAE